jgi:(1->4)-alpha-D-glucan 1-alpha-D-glucosylmutase
VRHSKKEALETLFPAEVERLTRLMSGKGDAGMQSAIVRLTAALPVYRLYGSSPRGEKWLAAALYGLRRTTAMECVLAAIHAPRTKRWQRFTREWQQLSGAAMAKGLEDRAHYRYTVLSALNEVGCTPAIRAMDMEDFCAFMNARGQSLNAVTTHDTKRSGDARDRLSALADMPQAWIAFRRRADLLMPPPASLRPAVRDLFLQSVLATWPLDDEVDENYIARIADYMRKTAREEAIDTVWSWPDTAYERMLDVFVHRALYHRRFRAQVAGFARRLSAAGALRSLSLLALSILSPGIPDIYWGTESWMLALVDPDNRRVPDLQALEEKMSSLGPVKQLLRRWQDGAIKIWLTRELLRVRGELLEGGAPPTITPLPVAGVRKRHVIAWELTCADKRLAVMALRYPGLLAEEGTLSLAHIDWGNTAITLPSRASAELLTGRRIADGKAIAAEGAFALLPLAVVRLLD